MAGPPIADGAVLIGGDGRIAAVGPDHAVPRPDGIPHDSLGHAALMPGLINTHTHLELTGFDDQVAEDDFPEWIAALRRRKAERDTAAYRDAARRGVRECWAAGVTTVADTGDTGAAIAALHELGGSGIYYHEVFGPDPGQRDRSLAMLQQAVEELRPYTTPRLRLGVSPHAPYSVSGPLYAAVAEYAVASQTPLAVHLAESRAETELVIHGSGPFAEAWGRRGIPMPIHQLRRGDPGALRSPVAWLDHHGVLGPDTLAIHLVQVDQVDVATLARRGVAVAHCPRSNRRHGHGDAPLAAWLAAGIRVGVGTDSAASVAGPNLLAEARAARMLGGLAAEEALALCTCGAADALGLRGAVGVLTPGAWGDVAAIGLRETSPADLYEAVLAAGTGDILATWVAGREVFRGGGVPR